jgi:CheY-like chemotaxis protein
MMTYREPAATASDLEHILVVDDDAELREMLSLTLRREGFSVRCATNGAEAIAALENSPACLLILLDLRMPVMDGWQFLARRAQEPRLGRVPVVVVSAEAVQDTLADGVDACLPKPVDLHELLRTVRRVCRAQASLR